MFNVSKYAIFKSTLWHVYLSELKEVFKLTQMVHHHHQMQIQSVAAMHKSWRNFADGKQISMKFTLVHGTFTLMSSTWLLVLFFPKSNGSVQISPYTNCLLFIPHGKHTTGLMQNNLCISNFNSAGRQKLTETSQELPKRNVC